MSVNVPPWKPEDPTPGNRVIVALIIALAISVGAIAFRSCRRAEPLQMLPSPMPAASSAAIATNSVSVVATQSVRVTVKRPSGYNGSNHGPSVTAPKGPISFSGDEQAEEIVVEVTQAIAAAATSSAQASANADHFRGVTEMVPNHPGIPDGSHGRLAVVVATMPGVFAADLQLARVDASPVTRPLAGVDMEVGLDVAGNTEAIALGATAGGKAFVGLYAWSRWNLRAQGIGVGVGLRF